MAKLLISYPQRADLQGDADLSQPPGQPNSEPYRVVLYEEVLHEILQNFAGIPEVIPVLSIGNPQCGHTSTLEAFLDEGNEESFPSQDKPSGVYVWTKPVPLNNVSLLLLKMWGVDFLNEEDDELDLINKKVMIALMSISSICLFCGERARIFESLTDIYELNKEIKVRLRLEMPKFLVFVDSETRLQDPNIKSQSEAFNNKGFENPPEILCRGSDEISATCKEKLLQIVGNLQNHQAYLSSLRRVIEAMETPDMISALAIILKTILDISRMDFDFRKFLHRIPNFKSPNVRAEMRHLEEMEELSKSVLSGTALEFFEETTIPSRSYKICESVLNILHNKYQTDKPIIVMPIFGQKGRGKSTLLNHIVKHLLGCSKLPELFKIGDTGNHTTEGSQVLSNPLRLGENQLMIVDLEGLEGVEVEDERLRILQENLISAIQTIASVPCILFNNEIISMDFAERIIKKLSNLNNIFGFKIERVHLLFHDRNIGADTNPIFENYIQKMNIKYFAGETVIKLLNKPNFCNESKAEMCEEFLRELMEDSNFPKKNQSGSPVLLKRLLIETRYITEYNAADICEISLTDPELQVCNEYAHKKFPELFSIFEKVKGDETNRSLELAFNEESHQFVIMCNEELWEKRVKWNPLALIKLETEVASHRIKIMKIQCFHKMIENVSQNDLWLIIEEHLDNLFRNHRLVGSFKIVAPAMKAIFVTDKERYPEDLHRMDQIIQKFEEKQAKLEKWFSVSNLFHWISESGGGLAAKGAVTTVNAARPAFSATTSSFRYITSKNLALMDVAIELFTIKKHVWLYLRTPIRLNSDAIRELEEGNRPMIVFLVIAAKRIKASFMLNKFIRFVAPLTPSTITPFKDSKLTQIVYFDYNDQRTCIIYLKMKKNKEKAEYKAVEKIAVSLIQKASFTCLFMNSPEEYASDIITKAFPPAKILWREEVKQQVNPRVAVIYPEYSENMTFLMKLDMGKIQNVRIRVSNFSAESLKCTVLDVKEAFDKSTPTGSRDLLEALRDAERANSR